MSIFWKQVGTAIVSECGTYRVEPGTGSLDGLWCLFIEGWEGDPGFTRFHAPQAAQTAAEVHDALRTAIDSTVPDVDSAFADLVESLDGYFAGPIGEDGSEAA